MNPDKRISSFAVVICLVSIVAICGFLHYSVRNSNSESIAQFQPDSSQLNEKYFDWHSTTPSISKRRHAFWANVGGHSGALKVLENSDLFNSVFPGYPVAMQNDSELWNIYFRREFGPEVWSETGERFLGRPVTISVSWTGCLEVFNRYGADVVILGTSETFSAVIPELLSKQLKIVRNPRILMCSKAGMPISSTKRTADELLAVLTSKAKIVIWGFSFWTAYVQSPSIEAFHNAHSRQIESYHTDKAPFAWTFQSIQDLKPTIFFPKLEWSDLLPSTWGQTRVNDHNQIADRCNQQIGSTEKLKAEGMCVTSEIGSDDNLLQSFLTRKLLPHYGFLAGISNEDCNLTAAEEQVREAVKKLKMVAENVYIFLAPVTQQQIQAAPKCFHPAVRAMLQRIGTEQEIQIRTDELEDYGLTYLDYTSPTLNPKFKRFNINHMSVSGARKVTQKLIAWINETSRDQSKRSKNDLL